MKLENLRLRSQLVELEDDGIMAVASSSNGAGSSRVADAELAALRADHEVELIEREGEMRQAMDEIDRLAGLLTSNGIAVEVCWPKQGGAQPEDC